MEEQTVILKTGIKNTNVLYTCSIVVYRGIVFIIFSLNQILRVRVRTDRMTSTLNLYFELNFLNVFSIEKIANFWHFATSNST